MVYTSVVSKPSVRILQPLKHEKLCLGASGVNSTCISCFHLQHNISLKTFMYHFLTQVDFSHNSPFTHLISKFIIFIRWFLLQLHLRNKGPLNTKVITFEFTCVTALLYIKLYFHKKKGQRFAYYARIVSL